MPRRALVAEACFSEVKRKAPSGMHVLAHAYNGAAMLQRHPARFAVPLTFMIINPEWVVFESKA